MMEHLCNVSVIIATTVVKQIFKVHRPLICSFVLMETNGSTNNDI